MPGINNIQDFQSLDLAHNLTFINDFKGVLKQQIKHFNADDYRKFKSDFEQYDILDSTAITEKDVLELSELLTRTYKYDALFLCGGEVPSNHSIFQVIECPFFSILPISWYLSVRSSLSLSIYRSSTPSFTYTGHTKLSTLQRYISITDNVLEREMRDAFGGLNL